MSDNGDDFNPWLVALGVIVVFVFLSFLCTGQVTPR